jgi:hypothetical protein
MGSRVKSPYGSQFSAYQIVPSCFFHMLVPRYNSGRFRLMFSFAWPIKQMFRGSTNVLLPHFVTDAENRHISGKSICSHILGGTA